MDSNIVQTLSTIWLVGFYSRIQVLTSATLQLQEASLTRESSFLHVYKALRQFSVWLMA